MPTYDLILLHSPNILNFREINISRKLKEEIKDELIKKGYLSNGLRKKILQENRFRQKYNSCVLYNVETVLESKWFHYTYY